MITIEVSGVRFEGFNSASVTKSLDTLSGSFAFNATRQEQIQLPFSVGEPCNIFVSGIKVITGFIDLISVNYSKDQHSIDIQGRDKTADIIDSTMDGEIEFNGNISFKEIIEQTLRKSGITDISVTDDVGGIKTFTGSDIESGGVGENIFDFLEQLGRKRQVLLNSDGDGNIRITQSSQDIIEQTIVNKAGAGNIVSGGISYDDTNRFNLYKVHSQDNNAGLGLSGLSLNEINSYNRQGESTDGDIRESRRLNIIAEGSYTDEGGDSVLGNGRNEKDGKTLIQKRAEWEQNIRRVQSIDYSATVQGFLRPNSDQLWEANKLVQVDDEFAALNAIMLVNSVTYSQSIEQGSLTTLNFVDRDAYIVEANKPAVQKRTNKTGLGL